MERNDPKPIFHAISGAYCAIIHAYFQISATMQLVVIITMLLISITSVVMIIRSIVAGNSSAVIE